MTQAKTVVVDILDKAYHIACPEGEEFALERAARFLDSKMREIRRSGKVVGTERIAVMAALNMTYELQSMQLKTAKPEAENVDVEAVRTLLTRLDKNLSE